MLDAANINRPFMSRHERAIWEVPSTNLSGTAPKVVITDEAIPQDRFSQILDDVRFRATAMALVGAFMGFCLGIAFMLAAWRIAGML